MDKLQKNIERVVAVKVLKDIHKIVENEEAKEKKEKRWALVIGITGVLVFVLAGLIYYLCFPVNFLKY